MLDRIIRSFCANQTNPYFRWGARYLAKVPSTFAREIALEQIMDYAQSCGIKGDYVEFGVFEGRTFSAACLLARERKLRMQLWAFDSFEGLPAAEGEFQQGQFACTRETFLKNVTHCVRDLSDVHVVPGWFSDTLVAGNKALSKLKSVAVAWIDCDLYESTRPVLEFLTNRLTDGSVICFDDWFTIKGRPDFGEQKACHEWLARNPQIRLMPYSRFGWHGQSFIAHIGNR